MTTWLPQQKTSWIKNLVDAPSPSEWRALKAEHEAELRRLQDRIAELDAALVKEAARTASEKRRADQMSQQHDMQAALNRDAREQLAAIKAAQHEEAIAEIVSASHDQAEFGERGINFLRDFQHLEYGTKLYAHFAPIAQDAVPMQPVVLASDGCVRFKENRIVSALLDHGEKTGYSMNDIARGDFTGEERMQMAQLIGYSVSGYGDLRYASCESVAKADAAAEAIAAQAKQGGAA